METPKISCGRSPTGCAGNTPRRSLKTRGAPNPSAIPNGRPSAHLAGHRSGGMWTLGYIRETTLIPVLPFQPSQPFIFGI